MRITPKILLPQAVAWLVFAGFLHFVWLPSDIHDLREALRAEAVSDLESYLAHWQENAAHLHAQGLGAWLTHIEKERRGRVRVQLLAADGTRLRSATKLKPFIDSVRIHKPWPGPTLTGARIEFEMDITQNLAATRQKFRALELITLCLGGGMLGLTAWVLRRFVVTPLQKMQNTAQRIAAGDFNAALDSRERDEIGALVRMLDDMRRRRAQADQALRASRAQAESISNDLDAYLKVLDQHALLCVLDAEGRIQEVNDKLCAVSGYACERLLGSDGTLAAPTLTDFQAAMTSATGYLWRGEVVRASARGDLYVVEYVVGGIADATGAIRRFICIGLDVTSRTQALTQMREAQQFANGILDSIPEPLAVLDQTGKIILVNRPWAQAVGHPHALAITYVGNNYLEFCDKVGQEYLRDPEAACASGLRSFHANACTFAEGIRSVIAGESDMYHLEYPCDTPIERRWFNGKVASFKRLGGGALVSHVNISQRKQVEEALQNSEKRLALALEASQTGLWEWDLQRGQVYYSEGWWQILGYMQESQHDLPSWAALIHPEDVEQALAKMLRHLDGHDSRFESRHRKRNAQGAWEWVEEVGLVVEWDGDGYARRIVGTLQVVSGRVEAELQLRQALAAAQSASAAKGAFLANMGHEVRTPLNGILGMLQLLKYGDLSTTERDYVETAERSGIALLDLLNSLLDYSKIEAGRMELEQTVFDPRALVEDAVALYAPQAQEKGLEIVCLLGADVPSSLIGDPMRLRQVLHNLLGNAVKFTEQGEVMVQVGVPPPLESVLFAEPSAGNHDETGQCVLHFSISDTGIGIQNDKKEQLFEAFSQLDNSITRKYGGTGLGLAICRRLVEAMGGDIVASNRAQGGSVFSFSVRLRHASGAHSEEGLPNWCGKRILIVDPNGSSRMQLQQCLSHWGIGHASAEDVALLRERLIVEQESGRRFDAVLLAHNPPHFDGLKVLRELSQSLDSMAMPIVLLAPMAAIPNLQATGVAACLAKPIRVRDLRETLRDLVGQDSGVHRLSVQSAPSQHGQNGQDLRADELPAKVCAKPLDFREYLAQERHALTRDFVQNAQQRVARLKEAAANNARELLCLETHALKQASQQVGANELFALCRTLQKNAYAENAEGLQRQVMEIEAEMYSVAQALQKSS